MRYVQEKLNFYALDSIEDAVKRIKKLKIKLGLISKETLEEEKMSLLNIPDDKLNAEQLKVKIMVLELNLRKIAKKNAIYFQTSCGNSSLEKTKTKRIKV